VTDEDGFLQRWNRRKTAQKTHEDADEPLPEGQALTTADAPQDAAEPEAVAPEDLPDIDSMDESSDFSVFMRAGVPEELKTLALRRLWRLDPIFNEVDGLLEYGEDFSKISLVAVKSIYKVGKGMLSDDDDDVKEEEELEGIEKEGDGEAETTVGLETTVALTESEEPDPGDTGASELPEKS
jgi:hypothetical protein